MHDVPRRTVLAMGATLAVMPPTRSLFAAAASLSKPIPHSGEMLPCVGLGTSQVFDIDPSSAPQSKLPGVLAALHAAGGTLIDTASTYGSSEAVIGALTGAGTRSQFFIATKAESPDPAEVRQSLTRLRTKQVDLLQLHNVRDPGQSLAAFRDWKAEGLTRYIGITSTFHGDFDAVVSVLKREKPDFVEIDYAIDNRVAEQAVLPAAQAVGAAVLTAVPLGRGDLFSSVRGKQLPDFAAEFGAASWAQFFLKWLIAAPAVTAVIPATASPAHMQDDAGAMTGPLPDAAMRERMAKYIADL